MNLTFVEQLRYTRKMGSTKSAVINLSANEILITLKYL